MKKQLAKFSFIAVCFFSLLISSLFVLQVKSPVAYADVGTNALYQMGVRCHHMKEGEGQWDDCNSYEYVLSDVDGPNLGCDKKMFIQRTDPDDDTAKLNDWYTDINDYAKCYVKAKEALAQLSSDKCRTSVDESSEWKGCEDAQKALWRGLGCNNQMYNRVDGSGDEPDKFNRIESRLENCKNRLENVAGLTLYKPDGSLSERIGESAEVRRAEAEAAGEGEDPLEDCDTQAESPLSWIACPLIEMGVKMTDTVFQDMIKPLLEYVPITSANKENNNAYAAWTSFRILANVLLVGTLLVIVYSQARGGK